MVNSSCLLVARQIDFFFQFSSCSAWSFLLQYFPSLHLRSHLHVCNVESTLENDILFVYQANGCSQKRRLSTDSTYTTLWLRQSIIDDRPFCFLADLSILGRLGCVLFLVFDRFVVCSFWWSSSQERIIAWFTCVCVIHTGYAFESMLSPLIFSFTISLLSPVCSCVRPNGLVDIDSRFFSNQISLQNDSDDWEAWCDSNAKCTGV